LNLPLVMPPRLCLILAALLPIAACGSTPNNVVIILADDLGFGDLGCYGSATMKTPRLDQMAAEGTRFTKFNTPASLCAPTRSAVMTGRYPFRNGMNFNPAPDGGAAADALHLPPTEITLAEVMRSAGYATGMVGKWHLGHRAGFLPTERGFDSYFGIPYSNDMRPVQLIEGTQRVEYPVVQTTMSERLTQRAVAFIEGAKEKQFFLYFAHPFPHKPLAPSEKHYRKSGAGLYGDTLLDLDDSVGAVLDALKRTGVDERTLVMFSSDNGAWFGGSTGGLRGMKGNTYEGGFRVPMIVRWPSKVTAGEINDELTTMMDLFATALDATGAKMPDDRKLDGHSLLPLFSGAKSKHEFIFGQKGADIATVRDARWKLHLLAAKGMDLRSTQDGLWKDPRLPDGVTILAPVEQYNLDAKPGVTTGDAPAKLQLFDLLSDPSEQRDVAAQHPDEVKRLLAAYEALRPEVPVVEEVKREGYKTR
jgi:arylsulfatase A-like enzyme